MKQKKNIFLLIGKIALMVFTILVTLAGLAALYISVRYGNGQIGALGIIFLLADFPLVLLVWPAFGKPKPNKNQA